MGFGGCCAYLRQMKYHLTEIDYKLRGGSMDHRLPQLVEAESKEQAEEKVLEDVKHWSIKIKILDVRVFNTI